MWRKDIDDAILSYTTERWLKVAMIIVKTVDDKTVKFANEEDELVVVAEHIEHLVEDGKLLSQGDLKQWRHSEVRKP